jgi:uncharacterized membrane protein YdjX (TVP38/TMEM64 family)
MEKVKKIKLFLALFYIIVVSGFLFFFFSKFSLQEITSYEFIKNNRDYFFNLKQSNLFLIGIFFILFTIVWVLAAGFGSPVAIFAGFIFGKWLGLSLLLIGLSVGATGLYIFANYFLKDVVRNKFLNKFQKLEIKFKESEFFYLLVYRFIGGIPFAISNILPCMFNVKTSNFFWATIIGMAPQLFLVCSIGEGLEKVIDNNTEAPSIIDLVSSPNIYIPILLFFVLLILTIVIRKIFYK